MAAPASLQFPSPSEAALKLQYVGKNVRSLPMPAAVLDAAVIRQNCKHMLETAKVLGLGFRAHIKTHKTVQLSRLQVGEDSRDIRLLVSTVSEAEHLVPWLLGCVKDGKSVNIIYGLPVAPSQIPRLANVAHVIGSGSVTFLVDHPAQVQNLISFATASPTNWPGSISVMFKIDAGYHRAGLSPKSSLLEKLTTTASSSPTIFISGVYCHMGHSYSSSSPAEALTFLRDELTEAVSGAETVLSALPSPPSTPLIISIGATPTATATQNFFTTPEGAEVATLIASVKEAFQLEIHAGVYPVLDMQQLATAARPASIDSSPRLSTANLGLRIMAEVASVYEEREKPEALVCAGSIVLGREPCKSYSGWGVVTPWTEQGDAEEKKVYDPSGEKTGWIVGRISQEHGILTWEGPSAGIRELKVGERVMIWPNHACMAGPSFGWYCVVDGGEVVTDIWVRCRGW
ncbi:D-serine dehydratase-like protein [Elsinoe fawcettii]|nr:D-serine dehydratase-like protein [Elsinoe fawcettii]